MSEDSARRQVTMSVSYLVCGRFDASPQDTDALADTIALEMEQVIWQAVKSYGYDMRRFHIGNLQIEPKE